jgi:hypothetical protein
MSLHPEPLRELAKRIPEDGTFDPDLNRALDAALYTAESGSYSSLICNDAEFVRIKLPPQRHIIKPILREGQIVMIYSWRGVGKTMCGMGMADAITTGNSFGPWEVSNSVTCLYLDAELSAQDTQKRLSGFGHQGQRQNPLLVYSDAYMSLNGLPKANLFDENWRQAMKQILLDQEVGVWFVDNIAALAPGAEENSTKDWGVIGQFFLELRFAGITTVFLHHSGKDGNQRGASGREDNLDLSIQLDKPAGYSPEDGCRFVLKFVKSRIEHEYLPLITDTEMWLQKDEDELYFWVYSAVKKQNKAQVVKRLDEGITANDIAEELGISKGRVSQIKSEAVREGFLTKEGKLTQTGFEWLTKN